MNANEYRRDVSNDGIETDELAEQLEDGKLETRIKELDSNWEEVMRLCEESGFIIQAAGGAAVISTNKAYLEANGPGELARRLRMCNVEL